MNVAHILLGRPWLYDLDVTSFGKSNTYTFLFNGKKIVLTPSLHKSQTNNQKNGSVTDKENEKSLNFVSKSHVIGPIEHVDSFVHHLLKMCEKICRQIVFSDETYISTTDLHERMKEFSVADKVMVFALSSLPDIENLHARCIGPYRVLRKIGSNAYVLDIP